MADKNLQMRRKLADGNFDDYFPITKAANVKMADGSNAEEKFAIPKTVSGSFVDTSTSIPANTLYTKTIPLGTVGVSGRIFIQAGGISALIFFDTVASHTRSISHNRGSSAYTIKSPTSLMYSMDATTYHLALEDCYLDGSNLILKIRNTQATAYALAITEAYWEVGS